MNRYLLLVFAIATCTTTWADDEPELSQTASKARTIEITIESKSRKCAARASLEYFQRGAEAEVETSIHTDECGAASGDYVLHITVRGDDDTQPRLLTFEEAWERSDDRPVETIRRYSIGDDVDLLRIKSRKLSCTCAETAEYSAEGQ